ncbi:hypothetical protein BDN70DRAFT_894998 [Pholiota conissans]|uniref:TEA domain-containing protein n=1 Tax=Pholiota conissans TaxID=109636 RepID=A0A9P6D0H4_9AGAR|nr:hypothetical protein BDN70DRAFT_894998 [Pholiota conissans]
MSSSTSSLESSPESHLSSTRHSTVDSFKAPALQLQNPRTQDVFQSIVKGRKSWKTLRGGEVVWPPELEAALIEGLENYQPDDSRETRLLGRFPMRNRFISDWIFEKTGKRRTAKQVGSRLQQLRDTCGGKRLLTLLSPNRRPYRTPSLSPEYQHKDGHMAFPPPLRYDSESCSDSSASAPPTPTEAHATLQNLLYRGVEPRVEETPETIVYIDLLPEDSQEGPSTSAWASTSQGAEERSWIERGYKVARASQHPRRLRDIDPTVTLLSKQTTTAQSYFTVHTDDGIAFSEVTALELIDPSAAPTADGSFLYRTSLVPGYWDTIAQSSDASQYVIIQRVVQEPSSTIFSAMYKFNYVSPSSVSSPPPSLDQVFSTPTNMIPMDQASIQQPKMDFPLDTFLSLETEGFSDMMGFTKASQNYFDLNYMRPDWNSSPPDSMYSSPSVDCSRQIPGVLGVDGHLLSPTSGYPMEDGSTYAL